MNLTPPSAPLSLLRRGDGGEVFYPASAIACLILGTLNLVSQGVIYITANRISSNISQTDREAVMQAIATIKAKLPFLIDSVNDCFENQTQTNTDAHR
ncbi:hypothetical protein CBP15_21085 [Fischerella thermalis WC442]|uniref:hypothetical protein n=1 Tax=Fischerella thermalis TaxID=372787 RepID=UPI000C7F83A1|nr:hypothetical protein [Fischerella thermalis]PLZ46769.1 hypothetical protein CBP15_21085 [Fischerella thermalis WC442]